MKNQQKNLIKKIYQFDAAKLSAGRLASRAAKILIGKQRPNYLPQQAGNDLVIIKNIDQLKFTGKKLNQKRYYRTSGYLGGLKSEKLVNLLKKDPKKIFRRMVYLMLPKNKLRKRRLKRLVIK